MPGCTGTSGTPTDAVRVVGSAWARNRCSGRSFPSRRSASAQAPTRRRARAGGPPRVSARERRPGRRDQRVGEERKGWKEAVRASCVAASTYIFSLPEFTHHGHGKPRKNNAQPMYAHWNLSTLESLGALRASGRDVVAFLQGQLSNDVRALA